MNLRIFFVDSAGEQIGPAVVTEVAAPRLPTPVEMERVAYVVKMELLRLTEPGPAPAGTPPRS